MRTPTPEQLAAMARLAQTSDGELLVAWVRDCTDATTDALVNGISDRTELAGKVQGYRDVLRTIVSAGDRLRGNAKGV